MRHGGRPWQVQSIYLNKREKWKEKEKKKENREREKGKYEKTDKSYAFTLRSHAVMEP